MRQSKSRVTRGRVHAAAVEKMDAIVSSYPFHRSRDQEALCLPLSMVLKGKRGGMLVMRSAWMFRHFGSDKTLEARMILHH